jgi:hypothetical protein
MATRIGFIPLNLVQVPIIGAAPLHHQLKEGSAPLSALTPLSASVFRAFSCPSWSNPSPPLHDHDLLPRQPIQFVDHVVVAVPRAEAVHHRPEAGAVPANAAQLLGREGGQQQLADGGDVML